MTTAVVARCLLIDVLYTYVIVNREILSFFTQATTSATVVIKIGTLSNKDSPGRKEYRAAVVLRFWFLFCFSSTPLTNYVQSCSSVAPTVAKLHRTLAYPVASDLYPSRFRFRFDETIFVFTISDTNGVLSNNKIVRRFEQIVRQL